MYAIWSESKHNYKATVTEPTCTEKGYTTHTCTICGNSYKDTYVNALGHDYVDGKCKYCGQKDPNYEKPENLIIETQKYNLYQNYLSLVQPKTTLNKLLEGLETNAEQIKIYKDGNEIDSNSMLGTGMVIEFKRQNEIIISGDADGDGEAGFKDIVKINKYRLGKIMLNEAFKNAADVTKDGQIDFKDIVKINKYRLEKIAEL